MWLLDIEECGAGVGSGWERGEGQGRRRKGAILRWQQERFLFLTACLELSFCHHPLCSAHVAGCRNSSDKPALGTRSSAAWSQTESDYTCKTRRDEFRFLLGQNWSKVKPETDIGRYTWVNGETDPTAIKEISTENCNCCLNCRFHTTFLTLNPSTFTNFNVHFFNLFQECTFVVNYTIQI